jgi:hypothetical protein
MRREAWLKATQKNTMNAGWTYSTSLGAKSVLFSLIYENHITFPIQTLYTKLTRGSDIERFVPSAFGTERPEKDALLKKMTGLSENGGWKMHKKQACLPPMEF